MIFQIVEKLKQICCQFLKAIRQFMWKHPVVCASVMFGLYIGLFILVEHKENTSVFLIRCELDPLIPFSRYAAPVYCLWHVEIFVLLIAFLPRKDIDGFWRTAGEILLGMYLILLICSVFPNMVDLRPSTVEGSDLFAGMTRLIYRLDNSQNVFPSGHALGAFLMAAGWERIVKRPWQRLLVWVVNADIVLSTLFLKQHSVIDIIGGIVLAVLINRGFEWIIRKRQTKAVTAFWSRAAYTGHDRDQNAL